MKKEAKEAILFGLGITGVISIIPVSTIGLTLGVALGNEIVFTQALKGGAGTKVSSVGDGRLLITLNEKAKSLPANIQEIMYQKAIRGMREESEIIEVSRIENPKECQSTGLIGLGGPQTCQLLGYLVRTK